MQQFFQQSNTLLHLVVFRCILNSNWDTHTFGNIRRRGVLFKDCFPSAGLIVDGGTSFWPSFLPKLF